MFNPIHRSRFLESDWFFYAMLAALAFFPNLLLGRVYFDADLHMAYGIYQEFLQKNIFQGHFPLWNPDLFGGQPFAADPCAMAFYPFLYPALLFPLPFGFGIFYFIHCFLALWGMHRWLSALGLSPRACRLGAATFCFSGYFWSEIIHPNLLATFVWLPWFFGALEALVQKPKPTNAFAAGLIFSCLFLAGHSQGLLGALYGGPLYFIFRVLTTENPWKKKWKQTEISLKSIFLFSVFIFALAPLLLLLISEYEFIALTGRFQAASDYLNYNAPLSLDPTKIFQFLFPSPLIDSVKGTYSEVANFTANPGYLGVWMPFFAAAALQNKNRRFSFFILAMGIISFLVSLGGNFPLHHWFCDRIPGFSLFHAPYRYLYLYDLFLPILVALGYDEIFKPPAKKPKIKWNRAAVFYALGIGVAGLLFFPWRAHWVELLSLLLGAVFWGFRGRSVPVGRLLFYAAFIFPLVLSGWICSTSRLGPGSNFDYKKNLPDLSRLQEKIGRNRVFIGDAILYPVKTFQGPAAVPLPANVALSLGIRGVGGFDVSLFKTNQLHRLPFRSFASLMAIEGSVTGHQWDHVPGFKEERWPSMNAYFSTSPRPFLFSPRYIRFVANEDEQLTQMAQSAMDPEKTIFLLDQSRKSSVILDSGPVSFQYQWEKDEPDDEAFDLELSRDHWVVFSEINYPGWKAWVDHQPLSIQTADYTFRGLFLKAGAHEVEFRFEPSWWRLLIFGLGGWLFGTAGFFLFRKRLNAYWAF